MHVYNDLITYKSSETNLTHYTDVYITSRADREFPYKDRVTKQMMIDDGKLILESHSFCIIYSHTTTTHKIV